MKAKATEHCRLERVGSAGRDRFDSEVAGGWFIKAGAVAGRDLASKQERVRAVLVVRPDCLTPHF